MPVYNGESFLEHSLSRILAQDLGDFELVISDNASTDRTGEICQEFAGKDARIRYSRFERNMGAARNFNQVFKLSSGKYFKWATHDDMIAETYLSRCVEVFENGPPDLVLVYPRTVLIDEDGAIRGETLVQCLDRQASKLPWQERYRLKAATETLKHQLVRLGLM